MDISTQQVRPTPALDKYEAREKFLGHSASELLQSAGQDFPGQVTRRGSDLICTKCKASVETLYVVKDGDVCATCLCPPAQKCERCV